MQDNDVSTIQFDPDALKTALEEANLSQADFNRLIGFKHVNTVNKIIKRKRIATASELLQFAFALNKDPKEFCKES
jgi:transcriptional regulator with XRE-family HTH domain